MSTPTYLTLSIYQGQTFNDVLTFEDEAGALIDLTGKTARMQVRESIEAATTKLDLTTENGGIALGGALGTLTFLVDATDTSALSDTYEVEQWVYDLEFIDPDTTVTRVIQGTLVVYPEVTR